MINKIILKLGKYVLACVISLILWNFAAQAMTAKDDIANLLAVGLYFLMVAMWIWLIGNEFKSNTHNLGDHLTGKCDCHKHDNK